ncbi:NADPH-dependent aldehyde reductase-like protein, chloroplastic [Aegilops tauschii subsp. strangulata]|uniref:Short-chain type dehydrogenase/reductase n=1 Tax=Aegilops tauschii TaxID=37682 RepID=N1QU78_AEGTA
MWRMARVARCGTRHGTCAGLDANTYAKREHSCGLTRTSVSLSGGSLEEKRLATTFVCAAPHILVANAGVIDDKYPSRVDTTTADIDRAFVVKTRGTFLCLREAANRMPHGGGGRIVALTTSVVGSLRTGYSAYTASKAAVEAMVRTMAKELKGTRITANCVAPGPTATDMFFAGKSDETVRETVETNPMERLGEVGDIAPVVGFLCTDAAEWINGQVIWVNDGICFTQTIFLNLSNHYKDVLY